MSTLLFALADRFSARAWAAAYCFATALAFGLWWALLLAAPESRSWFFPSDMTGTPLMAFAVADALTSSALVLCGILLLRKRPVLWLMGPVAGGLTYAALYCVAVSCKTNEAWIGAAAMSLCAGVLLGYCTIVAGEEPSGFRVSTARTRVTLAARTLVQVAVFWSILLWIIPLGIREFEQRLGFPSLTVPGGTAPGWILFTAASVFGLSASWAMVTHGRGTPLPSDCAPTLVRSGVYRIVRNPMASAGIAQGFASGLILGSYGVVAASILGGAFWHHVIRPIEERDMLQRFGEPYAEYRRAVGLWIPKRNPGEVAG